LGGESKEKEPPRVHTYFPHQIQFIENKLGAIKSIHQILSQSIEDELLRHVSLIHLDMNM
jgi:hypothetical protein